MSPTPISCRRCRGLVAEALHDGLTPVQRDRFDAHVAGCEACAAELDDASAALEQIDLGRPPARAEALDDLWIRLLPELDAVDAARGPRRPPWWRPAGWMLGGAIAGALATAWAALVLLPAPSSVERPGPEANVVVASAELDERLDAFYRRSTPLLLAVANRNLGSDAGTLAAAFDGEAERHLARRLAVEARDLSAALETGPPRREAALVSDLERVFLQLANLPDGGYESGLGIVQTTLADEAILFQISRQRLRPAARPQRG